MPEYTEYWNFWGQYFRDMQRITKINENIVSQKFGAIVYQSSVNLTNKHATKIMAYWPLYTDCHQTLFSATTGQTEKSSLATRD